MQQLVTHIYFPGITYNKVIRVLYYERELMCIYLGYASVSTAGLHNKEIERRTFAIYRSFLLLYKSQRTIASP